MSNTQGQYNFADLPTGKSYNVEVAAAGFKKSVTTGINVAPGENQLNSRLDVGSTAETVMVTAEASTLNTLSAGVGGGKLGVARRAHVGTGFGSGVGGPIGAITMSGRNGLNLVALAPGALDASREGMSAAANGQELGDLFEYKLKDKVTLRKNQSALVPIAQTEIEAEKISLWSGTSGSGRPLRGLWLKNTSPLTLDGGSFSVLEKDVFAGEGLTDPIKPGERRLVTYARDLGLLVEAQGLSEPQHVRRAKILKGVHDTDQRIAREHDIHGAESGGRRADSGDRASGAGGMEVVRRSEGAGGTRARDVPVPRGSAGQGYVKLAGGRGSDAGHDVSAFQPVIDDQIGVLLQQRTISPEMAAELRKITAQKTVVGRLEDEMESRQHDIDRIVDDQARLRENMKALKGSAEEKALLQRYTRQLDEQETQLEALRKKIEATEKQRDAEDEKLEHDDCGVGFGGDVVGGRRRLGLVRSETREAAGANSAPGAPVKSRRSCVVRAGSCACRE